jgi:DNA (cytosine-5)-methyltransferase 1
MKVIDFFCGSGGFSEGFRQAGFDVIWAVDKWLPAVQTHRENHPESKTIMDDVIRISTLSDFEFEKLVPDSEIIIGSPPCIAFSNSNKSGKSDKTMGIKLFEAYLRIIFRKKYKKKSILKYWILENVPNLKNHIKGEYSGKELGIRSDYSLKIHNSNTGIYNAKYYSVPSNRKRFFCGDFPTPIKTIDNENEFINLSMIRNSLGEPKKNLESIIIDPNYSDFSIISKEVSDHHYVREVAHHEWEKAKRLKQDKGYMGRMSFPENEKKPSRTIMATISFSARESMILGYNKNGFRAPTIREIASLMSFPIDYRFYGKSKNMKYKLVGNAVPPKLSFAFAKAIALKENLKYNTTYTPINHPKKIDFINLNFNSFHLNIEKPKKDIAKFKYHVPYLIINTYRVELTNVHSNFNKKKFLWNVEIHKSQGKRARVLKPRVYNQHFSKEEIQNIGNFIQSIRSNIVSPNKLQVYYCMTNNQRVNNNYLGPYELLDKINEFVIEQRIDVNRNITISYLNEKFLIPFKIIYAYKLLKEIVKR